jgi:hypothetical protein
MEFIINGWGLRVRVEDWKVSALNTKILNLVDRSITMPIFKELGTQRLELRVSLWGQGGVA